MWVKDQNAFKSDSVKILISALAPLDAFIKVHDLLNDSVHKTGQNCWFINQCFSVLVCSSQYGYHIFSVDFKVYFYGAFESFWGLGFSYVLQNIFFWFKTTWSWVNDNILIFWWSVPLKRLFFVIDLEGQLTHFYKNFLSRLHKGSLIVHFAVGPNAQPLLPK